MLLVEHTEFYTCQQKADFPRRGYGTARTATRYLLILIFNTQYSFMQDVIIARRAYGILEMSEEGRFSS